MDKFGKHWGEDSTKPAHVRAEILEEYYEDITFVDLMLRSYKELSISYLVAKAWAQERVDLVGIEGLNPMEYAAAIEHGLIIGGV